MSIISLVEQLSMKRNTESNVSATTPAVAEMYAACSVLTACAARPAAAAPRRPAPGSGCRPGSCNTHSRQGTLYTLHTTTSTTGLLLSFNCKTLATEQLTLPFPARMVS